MGHYMALENDWLSSNGCKFMRTISVISHLMSTCLINLFSIYKCWIILASRRMTNISRTGWNGLYSLLILWVICCSLTPFLTTQSFSKDLGPGSVLGRLCLLFVCTQVEGKFFKELHSSILYLFIVLFIALCSSEVTCLIIVGKSRALAGRKSLLYAEKKMIIQSTVILNTAGFHLLFFLLFLGGNAGISISSGPLQQILTISFFLNNSLSHVASAIIFKPSHKRQ